MNYRQKFDKGMTELMEKYGAFFAFGDKQFNESKVEGVKYTQLAAGLICPVEHAGTFLKGFNELSEQSQKDDIEENGIDKIIMRELANYECYYTGDIEDCVDALDGYPITREQIVAVYRRELPNQDF